MKDALLVEILALSHMVANTSACAMMPQSGRFWDRRLCRCVYWGLPAEHFIRKHGIGVYMGSGCMVKLMRVCRTFVRCGREGGG